MDIDDLADHLENIELDQDHITGGDLGYQSDITEIDDSEPIQPYFTYFNPNTDNIKSVIINFHNDYPNFLNIIDYYPITTHSAPLLNGNNGCSICMFNGIYNSPYMYKSYYCSLIEDDVIYHNHIFLINFCSNCNDKLKSYENFYNEINVIYGTDWNSMFNNSFQNFAQFASCH